LVRGSGGRSIAGIWPVTEYDGLTVLHPLLNVSRAETENYCRDAQLEFWNDPHNADESFTRVRVRKNVMPMLEDQLGAGVVSALARTAELLQADVDFLDALAVDAFASCVIQSATSVTVSLPALEQLENPVSSRVILRALRLFSSAAAAVHVNAVLELSTDWHGQKPLTLPGVRVERTGENLVFKSTKTLKSGAC
jgi:tRNA(Ile)-lysidine synthase